MPIERTAHMGFAIAYLQKLNDELLSECFKGAPVKDIRDHLAELERQGYEVYPCNCGNYDEKGRCKGPVE